MPIPTKYLLSRDFLMDSAHGSHHEGFTKTTDPNLRVEDGTNDDTPF